MAYYYDENADCIISEAQLLNEFKALQKVQPDEFDYTFDEYIKNCTDKNGFLQKVAGPETEGKA